MKMSTSYAKRAALASLCVVVVTVAVAVGITMQPRQNVQQASPQASTPVENTQDNASGTAQPTGEEQPAQTQEWTVPEGVIVPDYSASEYVAKELLATPAEGVTATQIADFLGATVIDDTSGFVQLSLPDGLSLEQATVKLQVEGLVDAAQPNYVYHTQENEALDLRTQTAEMLAASSLQTQAVTVNDPYFSDQWGLTSIKAPDAWEKLSGVSDKAVTVAVIDEGFDINHEDLASSIVGYCNVNGVSTTFDPVADVSEEQANRHGTHTAGIIAARANNAKGIAGVGFNKVGLFLVKAYDSAEEYKITTDTLVRAYQAVKTRASRLKIRVINLSIGLEGKSTTSELKESDQLLLNEIDAALNLGILTVCSAGNAGNQEPNFPGDYSNALSVIALAKNGDNVVRSSMSNYNPGSVSADPSTYTREISAPGQSILSTVQNGFNGIYYSGTSNYGYLDGTSMAAPHVSGVLGLMFAANPNLTASSARSKLLNTATDIVYTSGSEKAGVGPDIYTGRGEVNATAALGDSPYITGDDVIGTLGKKTTTLKHENATSGTTVWTSSNTNIAKISSSSNHSATIEAVSAGTVTITAKTGDIESSRTVYVFDPTITSGLTDGSLVMYGGDSKTLQLSSLNPAGFSWTWKVVDVSKATVSGSTSKAVITGKNAGITRVTVSLKNNPNISYAADITVQRLNLANVANVAAVPNQTYAAKELKPEPAVTLKSGATPLRAGVDFSYSWQNNKNAGTARVTIVGQGKYSGTLVKDFKIAAASMSNTAIKLNQTQYTYDGKAKTPSVSVTLNGVTLPSSDYTVSYSNNTNVGTATVTVTGKNNMTGSKSATFKIVQSSSSNSGNNSGGNSNKGSSGNSGNNGGTSPSNSPASISDNYSIMYQTHVQNVGWQKWNSNGQTAGTSGRSLRLESIKIMLNLQPYSGSIEYRTHVQNIGWQGWKSNGTVAGTSGMSLRLEAIQIRLTGEMANKYDVYYRVHAQNIGWMNWAKNGQQAGTAGYSYRLEAIQVKLVKKGSAAPALSPKAATSDAFRAPLVEYRTHVQNVGWQGFTNDGGMSGTSGRSLRLEGINIRLGAQSGLSGHVRYRTHIQNIGWEKKWRIDGAMSGTSGKALRLEGIQIELTGDVANKYDIYYRVHAQNFGWMGWAKNGQQAGTAGYAYRLEGIQIKLVPKGGTAPGSTSYAFRSR